MISWELREHLVDSYWRTKEKHEDILFNYRSTKLDMIISYHWIKSYRAKIDSICNLKIKEDYCLKYDLLVNSL